MLSDVMLDVSQRLFLRDCIISASNDAKKYRDLGYNKVLAKRQKEFLYEIKHFLLNLYTPVFYEESPFGDFFEVFIINGMKIHRPACKDDRLKHLSIIKLNTNLFVYNKPKRSLIKREIYENFYYELKNICENGDFEQFQNVVNKYMKMG